MVESVNTFVRLLYLEREVEVHPLFVDEDAPTMVLALEMYPLERVALHESPGRPPGLERERQNAPVPASVVQHATRFYRIMEDRVGIVVYSAPAGYLVRASCAGDDLAAVIFDRAGQAHIGAYARFNSDWLLSEPDDAFRYFEWQFLGRQKAIDDRETRMAELKARRTKFGVELHATEHGPALLRTAAMECAEIDAFPTHLSQLRTASFPALLDLCLSTIPAAEGALPGQVEFWLTDLIRRVGVRCQRVSGRHR